MYIGSNFYGELTPSAYLLIKSLFVYFRSFVGFVFLPFVNPDPLLLLDSVPCLSLDPDLWSSSFVANRSLRWFEYLVFCWSGILVFSWIQFLESDPCLSLYPDLHLSLDLSSLLLLLSFLSLSLLSLLLLMTKLSSQKRRCVGKLATAADSFLRHFISFCCKPAIGRSDTIQCNTIQTP